MCVSIMTVIIKCCNRNLQSLHCSIKQRQGHSLFLSLISMYINNKFVKQVFVHLTFENLRRDFNKLCYRCTVFHNKNFSEGFFSSFKDKYIYA